MASIWIFRIQIKGATFSEISKSSSAVTTSTATHKLLFFSKDTLRIFWVILDVSFNSALSLNPNFVLDEFSTQVNKLLFL